MKTIAITGTSNGLGKQLANYYSQEHIVFGLSRSKSDIESSNFKHIDCDVTNENDIINAYQIIKKKYTHLDILINNAGIASMNHLLLSPADTSFNILNTNVLGTLNSIKIFSRLLKKSKNPRVINISSIAAYINIEGEAIYSISKAAVEKLTKSAAIELADWNITVNSIVLPPYNTRLIAAVPKEKIEKINRRLIVKNQIQFKDIINSIDFIINNNSNAITGNSLIIGGIK